MQAASNPRYKMRVSADAVRPLGALAIAPASRFCNQIQQRYRQQAIGTASDLELRRSPVSLTQHSYHHDYHTQIQLSPRLHLTVLQPALQPHQGDSPAISFSAEPGVDRLMIQLRESRTFLTQQTEEMVRRLSREETETRVQQLRQNQTATVLTDLTDRLIQREVRIESVTTSPVPALQQSLAEQIAAVQPMAQTVRQSVVLPSPEAIAPPTAPQFASPGFSAPSALPQAGTASQATLDMNRLTEQVIQTIDRRLLAYRERLGRI